MGRYARKIEPSLAEEAHDFFLGLNCYLYGHKLKWQSGLEYNVATDLATTGDKHYGWGLTTGLRISW
jgi:phosphate-selective porin OprO/OprP